MSLDVSLMVTQPTEVYTGNITHNLGEMAKAVPVGNGLTLYAVLWRPDEIDPPLTLGKELTVHLSIGLNVLLDNREYYIKYTPENGWGDYDGLVDFTRNYLMASIQHPDSTIVVSR